MLYVDTDLVLADAWADVLAQERAAELEALADYVAEQAHPKQRQFVIDPGRRVCALVGRGGGKTTGGMFRFVRRMLRTPRANCLYIATTREQAEKLLWIPLKELCARLAIDAVFNESKLRCTFRHNGAVLSLAGADNKKDIEKYRGIPHHEVGIDECASYPTQLLEHLIERIIEPRLGDYNGMMWLIGTPGHTLRGTFYEATRTGATDHRHWDDRDDPAFEGWDSWSFHDWTLSDAAEAGIPAATSLWAEALRNKAKNGWGDEHPVWRREYLGKWAADDTDSVYRYRPHDEDGNAWNQWDPPKNAAGFAKLPDGFDDWCFCYGMDFGHKDPFALQVFSYSPTDTSKTLYHVYEWTRRGMYARPIAQLLIGQALDHSRIGGVIGETGWPEGMAGDVAGLGESILEELSNVYGIKIEPAPRKFGDKLAAIELFNGDLQDGRIKILKGSTLEEQLGDLQWATTESGDLKEDKGQRNDAADAAIYARRIAKHLLAEEEAEAPPYFPEDKHDITDPFPAERTVYDEMAPSFDFDDFDTF